MEQRKSVLIKHPEKRSCSRPPTKTFGGDSLGVSAKEKKILRRAAILAGRLSTEQVVASIREDRER